MVDLMIIKLILLSIYILHQIHMTITSMTEKSKQNLTHLQNEKIDTSFTNYVRDMDKIIYLISMLLTFLQIARDGLVIFCYMMVESLIWIIKNGKKQLPIILSQSAELLVVTLVGGIFLLIVGLVYIMDSIHECYIYLSKGKLVTKPRSCLITFCIIVKIGIKRLPRKLYGLKSHLRLPE